MLRGRGREITYHNHLDSTHRARVEARVSVDDCFPRDKVTAVLHDADGTRLERVGRVCDAIREHRVWDGKFAEF